MASISFNTIPQGNRSRQEGQTLDSDIRFRALRTARERIIDPKPVIPVAKYILRHWYRWANPTEIMLIIGVRQASFLPKEAISTFKTLNLSLHSVERWVGFSTPMISRVLNNKNEYLSWWFARQEKTGNLGQRDKFTVRVSCPLAPHHMYSLLRLVNHQIEPWKTKNKQGGIRQFGEYLQDMIRKTSVLDEVYENDGCPKVEGIYLSFFDMVSPHFAQATDGDRRYCEEFEATITHPLDTFVISHYFVDYWQPKFSSLESLLIHLCRDKVYTKGTMGTVHFKNAVAFGKFLRVDTRTAKTLLSKIQNADSYLAHFLQVANNTDNDGFDLLVNMEEPIFPDHYSEYERLTQILLLDHESTATANLPISKGSCHKNRRLEKSRAGDAAPTCKELTVDLQRVNGSAANSSRLDDKELMVPSQTVNASLANSSRLDDKELTAAPQTVNALIKDSESNSFESNPKNPQPQSTEKPESVDVVVNDWNISLILEMAGLSRNKEAAILLNAARQNPQIGIRFIAWIIWSYERKSLEKGKGIDYPEQYTLRHYTERPSREYIKLANEHPLDFLDAMTGFDYGSLRDYHKILKSLKERGFVSLLESLADEFPEEEETQEEDALELFSEQSFVPSEPSQMLSSEEPHAAVDQPAMETAPVVVDPAQASQTDTPIEDPEIDESEPSEQIEPEFQIPDDVRGKWDFLLTKYAAERSISYHSFLAKSKALAYVAGEGAHVLVVRLARTIDPKGFMFIRFHDELKKLLPEIFGDPLIQVEFIGSQD